MSVVVLSLILAFVLLSMVVKPPTGEEAAEIQAAHPAMDTPNGGKVATQPGDRGGWEQLALLGVMVVAVGGGVGGIIHTSRKARRRRDRELADDASSSSGLTSEQLSDRSPHDRAGPVDRKPTVRP